MDVVEPLTTRFPPIVVVEVEVPIFMDVFAGELCPILMLPTVLDPVPTSKFRFPEVDPLPDIMLIFPVVDPLPDEIEMEPVVLPVPEPIPTGPEVAVALPENSEAFPELLVPVPEALPELSERALLLVLFELTDEVAIEL